MCPTPLGRIHTRTAIIWSPALIGVIVSLITGREDFIVLVGVYLMLGVTLDACVYSWLLRYQPPWVTFVLAVGEFGLLYTLANILELNISSWEAVWFYWLCWWAAAWTKVVVLPLISLTYLESSFEFRRAAWSLPPQNVPLPVVAKVENAVPGGLVESASGVHDVPLQKLPSPSGVHQIPQGQV